MSDFKGLMASTNIGYTKWSAWLGPNETYSYQRPKIILSRNKTKEDLERDGWVRLSTGVLARW